MKKFCVSMLALVLIMSLFTLTCCNEGEPVYNLPEDTTLDKALEGYTLVFKDDFDTLDRTRWSVGYGEPMRRGGYYTEDAVSVVDGQLIIRTDYRENGVHGKGWYTGWVESASPGGGHIAKPEGYEGFSATYGYYEVRCKAPASYGIWSAFWLMPDTGKGAQGMTYKDIIGTGKDGVEVDVMESLHYSDIKRRNANQHVIHGDGYGDTHRSETSSMYDMVDMYNEFHTYGVMWTDSEYIFYIDGRETWRTPYRVNGEEYGVSEVDEYMLLTVEIAGVTRDGKVYPGQDFDAEGNVVANWAGNPNKNNKNKHYDFVVDYVRVLTKNA